jgi:hydrogenase-4 component B
VTPLWIGLLLVGLAAVVQLARRLQSDAVYATLVIAGSVLGLGNAIRVLLQGGMPLTRLASALPGGDWVFGVDPLSAIFLIVILATGAASAVYGCGYMRYAPHSGRSSHAWFALEIVALSLVVCARSLVAFLTAWEVMAIGSFILVITEHRHVEARRAGYVYLVATHAGTLALFALFAVLARGTSDWTFASLAANIRVGSAARDVVLALALLGFGVKAGLFPLHFWLPPAHASAPSHVSALMSGVVIKMGVYGLFRVVWLVGAPPLWWGWTVLALGVLSAILGVLWALAQHDIKRLLAYHSVENIGIILIGLGAGALAAARGNWTLALLGYGAALLHTINHGLFKSLLFFGAGAVHRETGTRDMERLGGLAIRMPATWLLFVTGAAAIVGLPPLNGFVSEWLVYRTLFGAGQTAGGSLRLALLAAPALALVGGLALACFVKVAGVVFLGVPRSESTAAAREPSMWLRAPAAATAIACAAIGLGAAFVVPPILGAAAVLLPTSADVSAAAAAAASGSRQLSIFAGSVVVVLALVALVMRWLRGRVAQRVFETWGCGYARPTPRMQYTASSFAAPLIGLFDGLSGVRAHRGATVFHTEPYDLVLDRVVSPAWESVQRAAVRLRGLQQGRLRTYLLYVVATVTVLLAYLVLSSRR